MSRREIIYLAVSNLITSTIDSLESMKNMPKDAQDQKDIALLEYILSEAAAIEDELRQELNKQPIHISRPNWDEIHG